MAWVATAIVGAGVLGAGASIYGSTQQTNAANNAINAQLGMFNTTQQNLQPYNQTGQRVLPTLEGLLTPGANQTETLSKIPGFTFAQDWGQKAVQNLGTTRGLGGNVLTEGAKYATGVAQQGWGSIVNALQVLVNTGGNAAAGVGNAAAATGGQIGSNIVGAGNAQAAGVVGATNGISNSVTTAALLSKLGLGGGGMYGAGSGSNFLSNVEQGAG